MYTRVYNPGSSDVIVYRHTQHLALFTPVCRVGPVIDMNEMSNICKVEVYYQKCMPCLICEQKPLRIFYQGHG